MTGRSSIVAGLSAVAILASCSGSGQLDTDLRRWVPGALDTSAAAKTATPRPKPDARGIISYPDYQVAVARRGETVAAIAARLGFSAAELASHNALDPAAPLEAGAIVALPRRVATSTTQGNVRDPFAGQPAAAKPSDAPTAGGGAAATPANGPQPRQHVVQSGETAWSIARKYGIGVRELAEWNGLTENMTIRIGQRLLIPKAGASAQQSTPAQVSAPGKGSTTPTPPSASDPLPNEKTRPAAEPSAAPDAPNLGANRTAASGSGRFSMPAQGAIIRPYEKGKNEGIDISASAGAAVKAAGTGTVAAITRDSNGVPIVVIRHQGDLMTVYTGLENLTVSKGDTVKAGQAIGKVAGAGIIHFEVRRGFESSDPEKYL